MVRRITDMAIHFLRFDHISQLLILLFFVHVLSDLRSGFVQTQDSSLRPETDLVLKEVSQLIERDALVSRGVNPSDD